MPALSKSGKFSKPLLGPKKRFMNATIVDVRSSHPFLDYACANWQYHVQRSGAIGDLVPCVKSFLSLPQAKTWIESLFTLKGRPQT
jgi:hypothetical protein